MDAIVNAALAQHAAQVAKQQAAHRQLLTLLAAQMEVAKAAEEDYKEVTAKAVRLFHQKVAEATRNDARAGLSSTGGMGAVERILQARQQLLGSEAVSVGRYSARVRESGREIKQALALGVQSGDPLQ